VLCLLRGYLRHYCFSVCYYFVVYYGDYYSHSEGFLLWSLLPLLVCAPAW
jgi:hypothetical protein